MTPHEPPATDTRAVADRYRRLAASFTDRIVAVDPGRWHDPSPCEGWTALDLVGHVVETEGMFLGLVDRRIDAVPSVDDDPLAAWTTVRDAVQAELDDPERAAATFTGFDGPSTLAAAIDRFVCLDLVVHGWDLARATGQDERLDPDEVRRVVEAVAAFGDAIRGPGVCGPEVEVAPGADEQTRMLALVGRRA